MTASKSFRQLVAIVAAALLLACQTTGVAHACDLGTPQPGAASELCHDTGTGDSDALTHCQSQHASSSTSAEAGIFAVAVFPIFAERVDQYAGAAETRVPSAPRLARAESPPLTILHCRLRN